MDERVLGDVPSEGNETGHGFSYYRQHYSDLKMRSVTKNVVFFATVIAAVIAFSIFYPLVQYFSTSNKSAANGKSPNSTLTIEVKQDVAPSNCSTQIFSFGQDCTEQNLSSKEDNDDDDDLLASATEVTTPDIRRFDEGSSTNTEEKSYELDTNLHDIKDFKFERSGRSNWPVTSTPYPYYKSTTVVTAEGSEKKVSSSQETNIFAIPYDLNSFDDQDSATSKVNITPPSYVFTPYPNFTGTYAQLSPYKVSQNNSNFIQVMKFLNNASASERHFVGDQPKSTNRESNTMKVSGTYVMPLDKRRPGEIILSSSSENIEEATPFFNGHAYVSDPFTKYRPTDPSDINRLIPVKSSVDTGPRFRKPVSFVPKSSVAVDITRPASYGDTNHKYQNSGSHTVAIFHPPAVVSQKPPGRLTPSDEVSKDKPLSVVLDIYPVTVDVDTESDQESSSPAVRERGRLNPKWKPKVTERPKWRSQLNRRPTNSDDTSSVKNHMILHLNLFPSHRKPYSVIRRDRLKNRVDFNTTDLPSGKFDSRSVSGTAEIRRSTDEKTEITTRQQNTTNEINDQPKFSALEATKVVVEEEEEEKEEPSTTVSNDLENLQVAEEYSSESNNDESNQTTLSPIFESGQSSNQSFFKEETFDKLLHNKSAETNATTTTTY